MQIQRMQHNVCNTICCAAVHSAAGYLADSPCPPSLVAGCFQANLVKASVQENLHTSATVVKVSLVMPA